MADRHQDAFVIVGWRDEDGLVTVCASEHPVVAEVGVVDVPMLETDGRLEGTVYAGRPYRFRMVDRRMRFRVEGYSEAGETATDGDYVPVLLRLLERWLPHDTDSVVEVVDPESPQEAGERKIADALACPDLIVMGLTDDDEPYGGDATDHETSTVPPRDGAWYTGGS